MLERLVYGITYRIYMGLKYDLLINLFEYRS